MKKNIVLTTSFIIAIAVICFDLFIDNESGIKLSEVYVSLAAFVMLIGTSILQNIELSMQRKDLDLTKQEMENQTNEFKENNQQSKFFELLKTKEEIYMNIEKGDINEFIDRYKDNLWTLLKSQIFMDKRLKELTPDFMERFDVDYYILNFHRESIALVYQLTDDDINEINGIIENAFYFSKVDAFNRIPVPKEINKLHKFNTIIEKMYVNKSIGGIVEYFKKSTNVFGNTDLNYSEIYKGLKTNEEIELYKILDKRINLEEFLSEL